MLQDVANASLSALNDSLVNTARFLPNLIASIVIFIVGVLIAVVIKNALVKILEASRVESLLERTVINRCEVLASGNIQVREANEIYDDKTNEVKAQTFHRYVVASDDTTPDDVQAFLDNSK